ncbi:MAG: hypothetical protein IT349_16535 [Candidatus Eisenbacteria bacterium]|nr:hypothetical protein [Candidatus Eisenbacteria bacterium]
MNAHVVRRALAPALLVAGLLSLTPPAQAAGRFEGSLGLALGFPSGDYGDQVDNVGIGVDLDGGWRPPNSPAVLGGRFGFMLMGRDSNKVPLSDTVPIPVTVDTDNNLVFGQAFLRLEPMRGAVRPFVEGVIGFTYLYTETNVKNSLNDESFAGVTQFKDTVLNFGGGGGLKVRVWEAPGTSQKPSVRAVFINARANYMVGGEGEYVKKGSVRPNGNRYTFTTIKSKTDFVGVSIGASLDFQ